MIGSVGLILTLATVSSLEATTPRNVILIIGDGMGVAEVQAAGLYAYGLTGSLGFERFADQALTTTYAADGSVTDSAAAATAMATGHKVNNGVLSIALPGDGLELTTILEYAQARGKSSGLVTTAYITHATPAAFAAHEPSRDDYTAIGSDILQKTRPQVLFGGASHLEGAAAAGYAVIRTEAELGSLDTEAAHLLSGQFSDGYMTYVLDRTPGTTEPTLALMTEKALAVLDNEPNGLFLMVEAGRIDHAGHAHDLARNVQETLSLDQAVQEALEWAAATGQASDTLILVAADHETGGLQVISEQGAGRLPLVSWGAAGHTGALVPVYATGLHSDWVRGTLDNTDLFRVMRGLSLSLPHAGPDLEEVIWAGSVFASLDGTRITGLTARGTDATVETDVLYVGSGGTGQLAILDGAVLATLHGLVGYGDSDAGRVRISGAGSLWDNHGQLVLGGDWSGEGGTGYLEVSEGALVKARDLTIWRTGVLAGDGTVQADSAVNHGTLSPGLSIGTLTIAGDLTFEPNSLLEVEVDNAGQSDKVVVTGTVAIHGGTVKAASTETITRSQRYPIVEASDVVGTFDALDTALLSIDTRLVDANAALGYAHDTVVLNVGVSRFDDSAVARTRNQRSLGLALQQIADSGGNSVTSALQAVAGEDSLRRAYDQLAGLTRPSLAALATVGAAHFTESVIGRTRTVRSVGPGGPSPGAASMPFDADLYEDDGSSYAGLYGPCMAVGRGGQIQRNQPWGLWIQGHGAWSDREGAQDRAGYRANTYSTGVGWDWALAEGAMVGVTAGAADTQVDYASSPDNSRMEAYYAGVYGSMAWNRAYLDTAWTYTDLHYRTDRSVNLTGEHLEGDSGGYGVGAYLEAGWNAEPMHGWAWQPLTSMHVSYVSLDDAQEAGGVSALGFARQDQTSIKGSLGLRITRPLALLGLTDATVCLQCRWVHEFGDKDADVEAHFTDYPSSAFTITDEGTRDSAAVGAGFCARLHRSTTLRLHYAASVSAVETTHVFGAVLRYGW